MVIVLSALSHVNLRTTPFLNKNTGPKSSVNSFRVIQLKSEFHQIFQHTPEPRIHALFFKIF